MKLAAVLFAAAIVLGMSAAAGAVDGTIEINQAKVLANGGFPFAIGASGSYRLTGNLLVSGASTDAIDVNASNVTIDLNGFSIAAPGGSAGSGIRASTIGAFQTTVKNGSITKFTSGVSLLDNSTVKSVHADSNETYGIYIGNNSVVEDCTTNSSGFYGIYCNGNNCVISGNTSNSGFYGIRCIGNSCTISGNTTSGDGNVGVDCDGFGCTITGNTANNDGDGIYCNGACTISGNTASSNQSGISAYGSGSLITHNSLFGNTLEGIHAQDSTTGWGENVMDNTTNHNGGTSLGHNLCSGTIC